MGTTILYVVVVVVALCIQTPCSLQWRLDELEEIIDSIENEIEAAITQQQIQTGHDYTNIILRTAGKSIVSMREIIRLSALGYPDGALSLARNVYEHVIILAFFQNHKYDKNFNDYVDDYYIDYDIQRNKALQYESKNCTQDAEALTALKNELDQLKQKAHHRVGGDYWWSGSSNFGQLVETAIASVPDERGKRFLHGLHFTYKRACVSIHSSCIGNTLRLGADPDFNGIDTSPTIKGHSLPLWFATTSFVYIMGVTYSQLNLDYKIYDHNLNNLALFFHQKEQQPLN